MTTEAFEATFGDFPIPVLLKTKSGWLYNTAAQGLSLSESYLGEFESAQSGGLLWLLSGFYRFSVATWHGELLVTLQPDSFLSTGGQTVSNQLRDKLSLIFPSLQDLAEDLADSPRAKAALTDMNNGLYQILRIADELSLCGAEDQVFCNNMHPVDLNDWFLHFQEEVQPFCEAAQVTFSVRAEASGFWVTADEKGLECLFLHLISNSIKHVPKDGTGLISVIMKRQRSFLNLIYCDNGPGLTSDFRLAPLWSRPDDLTAHRGLGLGLYVVQRIAAKHHSTFMSYPTSSGSRLVLSLPISADQDPEELIFRSPKRAVERYAGFSPVKIILSDAVSGPLYFPTPEDE